MHCKNIVLMLNVVLTIVLLFLEAGSSRAFALGQKNILTNVIAERASDPLSAARQAIKNGNLSEAVKILNSPMFVNSKSSDYYFLNARIYQEQKKNIEALINYSYSVMLDPKNVNALINRALVRGAMQDLYGAIEDLDIANKLQPQNPVVILNRAVTYAGLNKTKLALRDFDLAIKLKPDYADAYRNRGIARNFSSDRRGACADWAMASKYGDQDASAWIISLCTTTLQKRPS